MRLCVAEIGLKFVILLDPKPMPVTYDARETVDDEAGIASREERV